MWSSHLCGSPSTPGLHTLIQKCKFMTMWIQTISYNLLEYLQELCLGRLDPNRRYHFFSILMIYVGQAELIAYQRMKGAPPTCGFRQGMPKIAKWALPVPKVIISAAYNIQTIQLWACGARGKGVFSSSAQRRTKLLQNVKHIPMIWFFICTSLITIKESWSANTFVFLSWWFFSEEI